MYFKPRKRPKKTVKTKNSFSSFRQSLAGLVLSTLVLSVGIVSIGGCGLLGKKEKPPLNTNIGNQGCLNDSKDLVNRFLKGEVSETEWKNAFDCVDQSLEFFSVYVRGSTPNGYTQSDMYTLITQFLLTNRSVHESLLSSAFSLKRALFGGSDQELTMSQVESLRKALIRLREITTSLIPYLHLRKSANPDYNETLQMVAAFQKAGEELAQYVSGLDSSSLTAVDVNTLLTELAHTLELKLGEDLGNNLFLFKWVMLNSRKDEISGKEDWMNLFRSSLSLSGIVLAYKVMVGEDPLSPRHKIFSRIKNDYRFRDFLWGLGQHFRVHINKALAHHDGVIPFPLLDHIIDSLPVDEIAGVPTIPESVNDIPKADLKKVLRPLFQTLLASSSQMGIDEGVISNIYALFENEVKNLTLLDQFYDATGIDSRGTPLNTLTIALKQYQDSLKDDGDKKRFSEMQKSWLSYPALLYRAYPNEPESNNLVIHYDLNNQYTKDQLFVVSVFDPIIDQLIKTYASGPGYFTEDDFIRVVGTDEKKGEYIDLLFDVHFVDRTIPEYPQKRFRDMDLFMPSSDGNKQVSKSELMHFAFVILSSITLSVEIREKMEKERCITEGQDNLGWPWMGIACFRTHFHDRLGNWLTHFPRLQQYWSTVSDPKKAMKWFEHAARLWGYEDKLGIAKNDISGIATLLHYTEAMYLRFDAEPRNALTKAEIMSAYPVFKNILIKTIREKGVKSDIIEKDIILKGLFTYIVKYKEIPPIDYKNIKSVSDFFRVARAGIKLVDWMLRYSLPATPLESDRSGIFNIVCQLAKPLSEAQQKLTPEICKQ